MPTCSSIRANESPAIPPPTIPTQTCFLEVDPTMVNKIMEHPGLVTETAINVKAP